MRLDARLGRLEEAEREQEARQMAQEAGMPVEEVRHQLDLYERLLVVHDLVLGEPTAVERIRGFLIDFAKRMGDEEAERYAEEVIADWAAEQADAEESQQ